MAGLTWKFAIEGVDDLVSTMAQIDPIAAERAEVELRTLADGMGEILQAAAEEARATAMYASRTGNLDASTYAGDVRVSGNRMECEFGARAEYASFVEDRGFSRTAEVAEAAEAAITALVNNTSL